MSDFRRYQPRRASATPLSWRGLVVGAIVIAIVIVIWKVSTRGSSNPRAGNGNSDISLLDDNTNVAGNRNVATNSASNVNAVSAPDSSGVDVTACTEAISSQGTKKMVALTFNLASADAGATAVLDALDKAKAAGGFFVSGTFAEKNPEFIQTLARRGFGVYNRSYDNPKLSTLTAEEITSQLTKAEAAIAELTGRTTKPFLRPPYGDVSDLVVTTAKAHGYCTVLWTVDALDWQTGATVDTSAKRVVEKLRPGAIIMLSAGYDITPKLVERLSTDIHKAGYQIVPLPSLFST